MFTNLYELNPCCKDEGTKISPQYESDKCHTEKQVVAAKGSTS